jgi:hypothetical protein
MDFDLTIAGVPKLLITGTFRLTEAANRRCTASFRIDSADRSYRPAENAEVLISEDSVLIFGGLVDRPNERAQAGQKRPGISTLVNAIDFTAYAERRFVNLTLAAGTLKSQLTTLVTTYLATYSVTLDAGQVDGPSMPELTYDYKRFDAVMNELMTLTADAGQPFIWEISYDKKLSAYQPSTEAAPFDLTGNDLPQVISDIEVETSRSDQYANRIILKVLPTGVQVEREETFVEGVDSYPYVPLYTVLKTWGYVTHETIFETLRLPADPDPASWTWDPVAGTLTRDAGAPGTGETTIFKFDGVFEGVWFAEDAGEIAAVGLWEKVIVLESIPNEITGQAFADAELAKRSAPIITVKYSTLEQGLQIGQQQNINISSRNVNDDAVIVNINSYDFGPRLLKRDVTAVIDATQTNLGRAFQDDYAIWYGDKTGTSAPASVGTGASSSGGAAPPLKSVQFNRNTSFGGDISFTYDEATNSLACGLGSDITAANPESCQVFGYDSHITDP